MPALGLDRELDQLLAQARPESRYVDLALHLRRVTADFPAPVEQGHELEAGGVAFVTTAAGERGVPVRSVQLGAGAAVPDGAPIAGGGVLRAEVIVRGGGRWDTRRKRFGDPDEVEAPVCYDLMESQIEVARWFAGWLADFLERQGRVARKRAIRTLLNYGARGGGKTVILLLCLVCFCLSVPGCITYVISRSRPQAEVDITRTLQQLLPRAWYVYRGHPKHSYTFITGALLRDMTADSPEDLKQGRVDLALLNEGAKMDRRAYAYPLGRTKDRGGLMMIASNPPTPDVPKGVWVKKLFEDEREHRAAGKWFPAIVFKTDTGLNAAIDQEASDDVGILLRSIDPALATADADGEMASIGQRLVHAYDKVQHGMLVAPPASWRDITEEVTKRLYGRAMPFLAGTDFQDNPYIIATFFKVYEDPERRGVPILWALSDCTVRGSEDDFLDEVIDSGIQVAENDFVEVDAATVLWIADASAQWQDRKHRGHNVSEPPSFAIWRRRGLPHIVPPTVKMTPEGRFSRNPLLGPSYNQVNRLFGQGRLYLSPLAPKLQEACRECLAKPGQGGKVYAEIKYAHSLDTLRYVAWWVEPPTKQRPGSGGSGARSYSVPR